MNPSLAVTRSFGVALGSSLLFALPCATLGILLLRLGLLSGAGAGLVFFAAVSGPAFLISTLRFLPGVALATINGVLVGGIALAFLSNEMQAWSRGESTVSVLNVGTFFVGWLVAYQTLRWLLLRLAQRSTAAPNPLSER